MMKTAEEIFNDLNRNRVVKWKELSDGGKWTRAIEAAKSYADQYKQEIEKQQKEIEELRAEVEDWRNTQKRVMSEDCPTDEVHCTCVPMLKKRIEELEKEVIKWKMLANENDVPH